MLKNIPPEARTAFTGLLDMAAEQRANIQRVDIGITMLDRDLSMEYFALPVPNSPLAKALPAAPNGNLLENLAVLPKNSAYVGAGGPVLPGQSGSVQSIVRVVLGLMEMITNEHDRVAAVANSVRQVMAQCSQGRVIAFTTPVDKGPASTMVGVYHITSDADARAAVRGLVKELTDFRDTFMGGMVKEMLPLTLKTDAETVGGQAADLLTVAFVQPVPPAKEGGAPTKKTLFTLEGRIAYQKDKMLVTLGPDSKAQMAALVKRIATPDNAGYPTSAQYLAVKPFIPAKACNFEAFSLRDLDRIPY